MKLRSAALAALLAATSSALAQRGDGARPALSGPEQGAVMTIDGVPISADEYGRWMIDLFAARQAKRFAEQRVVRQTAHESGVELPAQVTDQRIDSEVDERVQHAFRGVRADWLDELRRTGWSEGGHREHRRTELEPWLLATELTRRERVVPEELVVRDWELFYGPQGKEYTLSGILIKVEVETPERSGREELDSVRRRTFAAALARALEVRERAVSGEDFAALARALSEDPATRADGGRIRAKFRPPGWNEPFVQSVLLLGPGAISMPMYAKGGYWVLRVEGLVETPLEAVRAELTQRLIELGPEDFEVSAVWKRATENLQFELTPELFEARGSPERDDPVIGLRINGEPVTRAEFATWLLRGRGEYYARDFTEHWCVERRARELGLSVAPAEIEARLMEFQQRMIDQSYKGSREAWLAYIRQTGRDEHGWRREWERRLRIDLLCEKILMAERVVTDEQVALRWQELYGRDGRWVEARMILVPPPAPQLREGLSREELEREIAAGREAARAQAEALRQKLADGEDFATLARAHSGDAPTRARGGRLEGRFRPDQWPAEVAQGVLALPVGGISEVLDTGRGFGLFEVLSSRPVPLEEVAEELRRELAGERPAQGDLAGLRNVLARQAKVETRATIYGR